jgi:hypothetical protein
MELKDVILSTLAEMEDDHIIEKQTSGFVEKKEIFSLKPLQKSVEENYDEDDEE